MAFRLLLDVDGVLVRNNELTLKVDDNVARYVSKKLPDCKKPSAVAKILYRKYGHTAIGLRDVFGIDSSDFDEFVYDTPLISSLWEHLAGTEFQKDAQIISELSDRIPTSLFSNSPLAWTVPVASAISDRIMISHTQHLKPDPKAYKTFPPTFDYIFVDDRTDNLECAGRYENWHPVQFSEQKSKFPTVSSIWELGLLVNSVIESENQSLFLI